MENLNAEQVKKALECCLTTSEGDCIACGYRGKKDGLFITCTNCLIADALALITSQEQRIAAQDMTISELRQRREKANRDADRYARKIKELSEENDKLYHLVDDKIQENKRLTEENEYLRNRLIGKIELDISEIRADTAKKALDAVRSRATRNAYSCMISGNIRETYTISGKALDEIEKELLEGENEKNTNII